MSDIHDMMKKIAAKRGINFDAELESAVGIVGVAKDLEQSGLLDAVFTCPGFRMSLFALVEEALQPGRYESEIPVLEDHKNLMLLICEILVNAGRLGIAMGLLAGDVFNNPSPGSVKN